jgi:hypothetical protein
MLMPPKRRGEADLAEQASAASVAGDEVPKGGSSRRWMFQVLVQALRVI